MPPVQPSCYGSSGAALYAARKIARHEQFSMHHESPGKLFRFGTKVTSGKWCQLHLPRFLYRRGPPDPDLRNNRWQDRGFQHSTVTPLFDSQLVPYMLEQVPLGFLIDEEHHECDCLVGASMITVVTACGTLHRTNFSPADRESANLDSSGRLRKANSTRRALMLNSIWISGARISALRSVRHYVRFNTTTNPELSILLNLRSASFDRRALTFSSPIK